MIGDRRCERTSPNIGFGPETAQQHTLGVHTQVLIVHHGRTRAIHATDAGSGSPAKGSAPNQEDFP